MLDRLSAGRIGRNPVSTCVSSERKPTSTSGKNESSECRALESILRSDLVWQDLLKRINQN